MASQDFNMRLGDSPDLAKWRLGRSAVHGKGVFAKQDLSAGDVLGVAMYQITNEADAMELTALSRFCNHGRPANVVLVPTNSDVFGKLAWLVAEKDIPAGQEIRVDYVRSAHVLGGVDYTWMGKKVPYISTDTTWLRGEDKTKLDS